jgi:hypothetical protein
MIRLIYYVLCITLMALFMWGLRAIMYGMGEQFAYGTVFGIAILLGLQFALFKLTGKTIFTEEGSGQLRSPPSTDDWRPRP